MALDRETASLPETNNRCPVEVTLDVIGGKWKPVILHYLIDGSTKRFGELKRLMPGITQRMLTNQLRELERAGIVHRVVYREVPPRVEYSITESGKSLGGILELMRAWGVAHLKSQNG